jgi:methylenetetrahydrofolate reductase (NADPH)
MTISVNQLEEARRALEAPLFADLAGDAAVSFEFFPPKTEKMEEALWETVRTLEPFGLTCVEASRAEIDEIAEQYWAAGVRHIVALRGDAPGAGGFVPHPEGYTNAADLVAGLKRLHPFEISVAAYPECHPDSRDQADDLDNLKRKLDAGATRGITQFFFEPETFFRFRDRAAAAGITAEMVPGIMPVTNFQSIVRMSAMCGTVVPPWMGRLFEGLDDHPASRQLIAATLAAELCRKLYAGDVRNFHFYTLNRAELSFAICHLLGLRAKPVAAAAAA